MKLPLALWLLISTFALQAQTFHAITIADTKDATIGEGCVADRQIMKGQFETIAKEIHYTLDHRVIDSDHFGRLKLDEALSAMQVAANDVIFFYYTGHGLNRKDRASEWPILHLKDTDTELEVVHQALKGKKPKFMLTLSDCCNNLVRPRSIATKNLIVVDDADVSKIYAQLFVQATGDIMICSSSKTEFSYTHPVEGSFYTNAFRSAIESAASYNNNADWNSLLADASNRLSRVQFIEGKQRPRYQINLTGQPNPNPSPQPTPNPSPAPVNEEITFDKINRYLNDLADESIKEDKRLALMGKAKQFFKERAKVQLYVNKTLAEVMPIEDYVERLVLNASKIHLVNLIENHSTLTPDKARYAKVTVQELWDFEK